MKNWDYRRTWYHGSQQELTTLHDTSDETRTEERGRAL